MNTLELIERIKIDATVYEPSRFRGWKYPNPVTDMTLRWDRIKYPQEQPA